MQNVVSEPDTLYKSVEVEVRSGEPAVLKSYEWFAKTAASHLGISIGKWWGFDQNIAVQIFLLNNSINSSSWSPPKPIKDRLTLLKSIHVYKKHRVQYEIRTYFTHLTFHNLTGSTADTFLEYIQRNLPEGVGMKVTKVTYVYN